jgi:hypothetical protein
MQEQSSNTAANAINHNRIDEPVRSPPPERSVFFAFDQDRDAGIFPETLR